MILFELYNVDVVSKILEYLVIVVIVFILYNKIPKSKKIEKEDHCVKNRDIEMNNVLSELRVTTSKNSYEIHNLQLENYELRNKLDKIYSNDLNENISYYKNILSMNEKIEYMQKLVLKTSELNDKFDVFTNYVDSKMTSFHRQYSYR